MSKYLILYRAGHSAAEQMAGQDPETAAAGMQAWADWATKAGAAIIDLGSPTQTVAGADPGATSFIGGYSVMQATDLTALNSVLAGHPHTAWGGTIEVLELLSIPGM